MGLDIVAPSATTLWKPQVTDSTRQVLVVFGTLLLPQWDEDLPHGSPLLRRLARWYVNSSLVSRNVDPPVCTYFPSAAAGRAWLTAT